jgi:hypothetical protein
LGLRRLFEIFVGAALIVWLYPNHALAQSKKPVAVDVMAASAARGDATAQYNMGERYYLGSVVPQDYAEAARWFRLSAEQGHQLARTSLGAMHESGKGVAQDYAEAARWYRLAADQGEGVAQNNLGNLYYSGKGLAQNYAEAEHWFRLAAKQGIENSSKSIRMMEVSCQTVANPKLWGNLSACQTVDEVVSALLAQGVRSKISKLKDGSPCVTAKDRVDAAGMRMSLSIYCSGGKLKWIDLSREQSPDGIYIKTVQELRQIDRISRALGQIYGNPVNKQIYPKDISVNSAAFIDQDFSIFRKDGLQVSVVENALIGRLMAGGGIMPSSITLMIAYKPISLAEFEAEVAQRRSQAEQNERDRRAREGL